MYMPLSTMNAFIATIFAIVVLISTNDSDIVLRDLNWCNGDYYADLDTDATIWVSVYQFGAGNKDDIVKVDWTSDECTESYCSDCKKSMRIVLAFLSLYFVSSVASVVISSYRCIPTGNNKRFRNSSILVSLLSVVFGIVGVVKFAVGCERKIKDYVRDNSYGDVTWYYGPSFDLLIAATSLSFINVYLHWRTPITEVQPDYKTSLMNGGERVSTRSNSQRTWLG